MGCPASSVTLPTTAAEVTPWAASSRNGMNPTRAPRIQNDRTSFVIRILQRDTNGTGWPGRGKCAPPSEGRQAMRSNARVDRKSTRLNSSHGYISYAVFCLKKKKIKED